MRIRLTRCMIIGLALALFGYFYFVPPFWPAPTAELRLPRSARFDQDAQATLIVSSAHANVQVTSVYLVANYDDYQELGLPAGVHPIPLYHADNVPQFWRRANRITWPRTRRYKYTIPLRELASQDLSTPGVLQGRAHLQLNYPDLHRFSRIPGYGYRMHTYRRSIPFTITLTP